MYIGRFVGENITNWYSRGGSRWKRMWEGTEADEGIVPIQEKFLGKDNRKLLMAEEVKEVQNVCSCMQDLM